MAFVFFLRFFLFDDVEGKMKAKRVFDACSHSRNLLSLSIVRLRRVPTRPLHF